MPSVRADAIHVGIGVARAAHKNWHAIHVGIGVTRAAHKNWHAIDEKIIPVKVPFAI
jgi:hypothetical protein